MKGRIHIVGAGMAGLSAALAATRLGHAVTLYEAAPQPGGRSRMIRSPSGFSHDNGTHVLFTANRRALRLIETIGARGRWIEPEADGLPIYDACRKQLRRVGLSPWSWFDPERRPEGFRATDALCLLRLGLSLRDRPVGAIAGPRPITRTLIEPLTVAVLNTSPATASSKRLATALRRLARPGAAKLLVAQQGLGADLIEPTIVELRNRGAALLPEHRLRTLVRGGDTVTALVFADKVVPVEPGERVILALPPSEIARLLPGLPVPADYEPILNVHYRWSGPDRPRLVGLLGCLSQWALVRRDHLSVTVSAAGRSMAEDGNVLAARIWNEIAPALDAAGLTVPRERPEARVIKERRATIRQNAGVLPQPPIRPLANLALAGDWIGTLPATIESAVISGERAVTVLSRSRYRAAARPGAWALAPAGGAL